jgi:hypothetical protein
MINANEAYQNYLKCKNYTDIEKFVISVCEHSRMTEHIAHISMFGKQTMYNLSSIFQDVFLSEEQDGHQVYTLWKLDYSKLPKDLYGKQNYEVRNALKNEQDNDHFIRQAFFSLIETLENKYGYKVCLDLDLEVLSVSWNLKQEET